MKTEKEIVDEIINSFGGIVLDYIKAKKAAEQELPESVEKAIDESLSIGDWADSMKHFLKPLLQHIEQNFERKAK